MRIAVLHDYFEIKGGGERSVIELAKALGADLITGYITADSFFAKNELNFDLSRLVNLNSGSSLIGYRTLKLMQAFKRKTRFLKDYDVAIYSGNDAICAVENHLGGKNIFYCHTPPRHLYDKRDFFWRNTSWWKRIPFYFLLKYTQPWYEKCVRKMDVVIANSRNVQKRIQKYLGIQSRIIYPPVETGKFSWRGQDDFYLSPGRLIKLKRVDVIVRAFQRMPDKRLVVVSGGEELANIRKLAEGYGNILVKGWVSEEELAGLVGRCIATIYVPYDEDFGLIPVESMAAGKPCIGVREGGLTESIIHGRTGYLCPKNPSPEDIIRAAKGMSPEKCFGMKKDCETRAKLFSRERFIREMKEVVFEEEKI